MTAYLITTGSLFALIVIAHVLRIIADGLQLLTDPWWLLMTLTAACLSAWAWLLVRRSARPGA